MDKIMELKQELSTIKGEVRSLLDENKVEDAETKMEEVRALEAKIKLEKELAEEEERQIETKMKQEKRDTKGENNVEERQAFINVLRGKATEEERALVQGGIDADGGYLVPAIEENSINELKRNYKSAKELVNIVPVNTASGSFVIEDGDTSELVNFDDETGGLDDSKTPKFKAVNWKVDAYGALVPITRTFLQDEQGGFMTYLNRYFAKRAVKTENTKIFATLKEGKTAKKVDDIKGIKEVINVDLDATIAANAIIITNQNGFNLLDQLEDKNGRGLLQDNPTQETAKMLLGKPVHVFSNAELKDVAGRAPMYVGDINEAVQFMDRGVYEVAISEHSSFGKNRVDARVIERFDVVKADADAYEYIELEKIIVDGGVEG